MESDYPDIISLQLTAGNDGDADIDTTGFTEPYVCDLTLTITDFTQRAASASTSITVK